MRRDKALAREVADSLDRLHDRTVSENPFAWTDTEAERRSRHEAFVAIGERLLSFVYVSRAATVAKLVGIGVVTPLVVLALISATGVPAALQPRVLLQVGLVILAAICGLAALAVWWHPRIESDLSLAAYAVPRGWSFSRRNGASVWALFRNRFSYFDRGDDDQSLTHRLWGYLDDGRQRPFMMFVFYWVDVEVRTTYNAATKTVQTKTERVPRQRHGIFVAMPESRARMRVTEVGSADELDKGLRLEYSALNKAVDVYCRGDEELPARQFLSPAVQEILLQLSRDVDGLHLDFYPGFVLFASDHDFLDNVPAIRLDRDASRFETQIAPWIAEVERFRGHVEDALRGMAKYND